MRLVPFTSRIRRNDDPLSTGMPSLRNEMDRMFDRLVRSSFSGEESSALGATWVPSVDISETEGEIVLRAEVPGIKPDDIEITVSGDRLIIAGEKSEESEEKQEHYYHCERRFGMFERSIELPTSANLEKVSADYSNGVLTVHVPKLETAKPKRIQIESKAGQQQSRSVSVGGEKPKGKSNES